jgi:glycosyltransferase involved in cell wall biosynthesis
VSRPLVTAIVPVWDGERYLAEAIGSLAAQSFSDFEVVVVDDGSRDRTSEIARGHPLGARVVRQDHAGLGAAMNRGVAEARGDLVAFLDHDDLWAPEKLARQVPALFGPAGPDMVFAHMEPFVCPTLGEADRRRIAAPGGPVPGWSSGTLLARREVFERAGPFGVEWRAGVFVDWQLRAKEAGLTSVMLPDVLLRRRLHPGNTWLRRPEARGDMLRILKTSLDRRRRDGGG